MNALETFLPQLWFFILGLFLFLYVLLDGFDLGVGILSLTSSTEERRGILMTSLGNVWDANETWLVLMGGSLFGAFPLAYGTVLNALYLPAVIMVVGLIFRAVSFEFRENAENKLVWNITFGAGSFLAALGQGFALAAIFQGIKVDAAGHFAGGPFDWLTWRSLIVALTLIQGYVLIGSTYLILKTTGELQDTHYRTAKIAAATTFAGAAFITASTPVFYEQMRSRLFDPPQVYIFAMIPVVAISLVVLLWRSLQNREEATPF
ncbi:MAG: cytochrome d ubiquinol oxidase subunit II, partial [Cyanobacteria bacterium J06648_11]